MADAAPRPTARIDPQLLVERWGTTLAEQAGIELDGGSESVFQLLVLTLLLSRPIGAKAAIASAREMFAAGWTTTAALAASSWRQRVDALGRGGYRRYDFSTADRLAELVRHVDERWHGDLTAIRHDPDAEVRTVEGIGPSGAAIFCREVSVAWPEVVPPVDAKVRAGALAAGLIDADLASLTPTRARLFAALAAVGRRPALLDELREPTVTSTNTSHPNGFTES